MGPDAMVLVFCFFNIYLFRLGCLSCNVWGIFGFHCSMQDIYLRHSVQFSHCLVSDSLQLHGLQHARLPCPSPAPGPCSNSCPLSRWCYPTILFSVVPFSSCLHSFLATGSFQMSQIFLSDGQRSGASTLASVLSMNIQGWFLLGLTVLISLQSKGFSQESFPTLQFKNISSSVLSFLHGPALTSIHNYWESHSFDYTDLCWQSNVSAF